MVCRFVGRGVAVYEMPLHEQVCDPSGGVGSGALTTLAEAAMSAAAMTTVADDRQASPLALEICARFDRAVDLGEAAAVRAEAVVMRTGPQSIRVEAELHCDGARVATCEAVYACESRRRPTRRRPQAPADGERELAQA